MTTSGSLRTPAKTHAAAAAPSRSQPVQRATRPGGSLGRNGAGLSNGSGVGTASKVQLKSSPKQMSGEHARPRVSRSAPRRPLPFCSIHIVCIITRLLRFLCSLLFNPLVVLGCALLKARAHGTFYTKETKETMIFVLLPRFQWITTLLISGASATIPFIHPERRRTSPFEHLKWLIRRKHQGTGKYPKTTIFPNGWQGRP
jgi:hypothetical protein